MYIPTRGAGHIERIGKCWLSPVAAFHGLGVVCLARYLRLRVRFEGVGLWGCAGGQRLGVEFGGCVIADLRAGLVLEVVRGRRWERGGPYAFGGQGLVAWTGGREFAAGVGVMV